MNMDAREVENNLSELLNECLESMNQEGSFRVIKTDLDNMKFTVEFDIIVFEEDDYVGFQGY